MPLKIAWKVAGATGIALSVDNPDLVGGARDRDERHLSPVPAEFNAD